MKNVLFLFSFKRIKSVPNYDDTMLRIKQTAPAYNYKPYKGAIKEMHFKVINNRMSVYDPINKRDVSNFDFVFFRHWWKEFERATAIAIYLRAKGVPYMDKAAYSRRTLTKLTSTYLMAADGLPVPDTFFSTADQTLKYFKKAKDFKYPLIVKDIAGTRGANNHLVQNYGQLKAVLHGRPDIRFMIQQYIPNDRDYRFLTAGANRIGLVIMRTRSDPGTHLNNTSKGAEGKVVPVSQFSKEISEHVLRAAELQGRDFSGVDIIINKETGRHFMLEVNPSPDLVVGAAVDEKLKVLNKLIATKAKAASKKNSKAKRVVGRRLMADLPQLGLKDILIKIDTGSYHGSLHCQSYRIIKKGKKRLLEVTPLDDTHPLYKPKTICFKTFRTVSVRNTSGKSQRRYLVSTPIVIDGVRHTVDLSLADRRSMRVPVLIGRKFLRGKFLVDVDV